jgi:dienelactone hydrolase
MRRITLLALLAVAAPLLADGPGDNNPDNVKPIPPKAAPLPDDVKKELTDGLKDLQKAIAEAETAVKGKKELADLLPDVQIYEQAVRYAVEHGELYVDAAKKRNDVPAAKDLLKKGAERAKELAAGKPSWTTAKGAVVRGYKSKIDGSVQPYGIVVPDEYDFAGKTPHRLDFWWHGRFEDRVELQFIADRQKNKGEFTPAGALVVHPFGRFSNANKFAGEVDTFEVLDHVHKHYRVDDARIVARGFSMGGAACWQYATHYPTLWVAAAPGAGFAETKEFLNFFQNEKVKPEWWEEKLWRMYDATEYAGNLFNLPTVAYSGENDKQKQAADIMVKYAKAAGVEFPHIIGKGAGHNYTADAKKELNEKIDAIVAKGKPAMPEEIKFTTYTTRYNRCGWVAVTGLEKHWEKGTVTGTLKDGTIEVKTSGVTELAIPVRDLAPLGVKKVVVDGTTLWQADPQNTASAINILSPRKVDGKWQVGTKNSNAVKEVVKGPGLQGPIDDAFMDSFVMVRPTGKPLTEKTGKWVDAEMAHAVKHWRQQFRGDAPIKDDKDVTDDDIKNSNLILWGDAQSNAVLGKMAAKLPVQWITRKEGDKEVTNLALGGDRHDSETHMPVLVFPNPLNPNKYVVLNSGFTFREYDYLNNARQVSKLPDYAVIDITTPPNSRFPGKVVRAGFFDEQWKLQKGDGK